MVAPKHFLLIVELSNDNGGWKRKTESRGGNLEGAGDGIILVYF